MLQQTTDEFKKSTKNPALKLLLVKKYIILTPCISTQLKLENEQRKSCQILISRCWPTYIRLFGCYRKRGLGPDQSHYNQSWLWARLHTTLAQITRITPKWIHTEYTVLKTVSPFRTFEELALALKHRVCPEFTALNIYFLSFRIFEQLCACSENQCCFEIFHCIEIFCIIQDFLATCACPENRVCPKIFQVGEVCRPPASYAYGNSLTLLAWCITKQTCFAGHRQGSKFKQMIWEIPLNQTVVASICIALNHWGKHKEIW